MHKTWKVLLVDDDISTHEATKIQFKRIKVSGKPVEIISAFSKKEALCRLHSSSDIRLIIVDMVMEEDNSGTKLIEVVRKELKNDKVRIIIRTGCLDILETLTEPNFCDDYDVGKVCKKGDEDDFIKVVDTQLKKYKVGAILTAFVVKTLIDLLKKWF